MTITIKKISQYALLSTIIGANATSPAQANSLKNVTPDDGFTKAPQQQTSVSYKNILAKAGKSNYKVSSRISLPEFDLQNQFTSDDATKPLKDSLLEKPKNSIRLIEDAEDTKVEILELEDGVYYVYNTKTAASLVQPVPENQQSYINTYTNVKQKFGRVKKKVPEPSVILGLIAFCLLAAKYRGVEKIARK